jgi:predicted CoA-binding protein
MEKPDLLKILKASKRILLIDWPDKKLPLGLLSAGFEVFSYSPDNYSRALCEGDSVVFEKIGGKPDAIDIVNVFRPESELEGIITKHVMPVGAGVVWLHPPVTIQNAVELESEHHISIIQGDNVLDVASRI